MKSVTKWMLAAALAIGGLGLTASPAKAAQIGFYVGTGPGYLPPSPGPGYTWIAGYYANGYWIPGRWARVGPYRHGAGFYRGHDFYRDHFYRDHDRFRTGWRGDRGHYR
jgi:hypothetical protein